MVEGLQQGEAAQDIFEKRATQFQKENPEESRKLVGELMYWASAVPFGGTLGEILSSQINFQVQERCKRGETITTKQFVDTLFSPNPEGEITADIIMARLQLS